MDPNIPAPCDIYIEVEIGVNCLLSLSLSSAGKPEQDPYVDGDLLRSCSGHAQKCSAFAQGIRIKLMQDEKRLYLKQPMALFPNPHTGGNHAFTFGLADGGRGLIGAKDGSRTGWLPDRPSPTPASARVVCLM
jgi:hypothetical protein